MTTAHERLLDAVLDGQIGNDHIVTRQEVINFFHDLTPTYAGVLLSNAEMETSGHSPTWAKYTHRIGTGIYRIDREVLARRARER